MKSVPVCIVGGGPVGMNLALNLAALGVCSILVNADPESLQQPRGSTQNARTMEHYRRLGLARLIRTLGLPPDHPTDVTYSTRTNGWELARLAMPSENEKMRRVREASRPSRSTSHAPSRTSDLSQRIPPALIAYRGVSHPADLPRGRRPNRSQGVRFLPGARFAVAIGAFAVRRLVAVVGQADFPPV